MCVKFLLRFTGVIEGARVASIQTVQRRELTTELSTVHTAQRNLAIAIAIRLLSLLLTCAQLSY